MKKLIRTGVALTKSCFRRFAADNDGNSGAGHELALELPLADSGADPAFGPAIAEASIPARSGAPEAVHGEFDYFCLYPFFAMNIMPAGTIKPCCAYNALLEKDGRPMSVYQNSVEDIWNSEAMRGIRADMVEGRPVAACEYCYALEREGLSSMRTQMSALRRPGKPLGQEAGEVAAKAKADNFAVPGGPEWLYLDVGNLCNLKCRTCNSSYSSKIANDPVHARWTGLPPAAPRWQGNSFIVAPRQMLGVVYAGFGYTEPTGKFHRSWTNGDASVRLDARDMDLSGVSIRLVSPAPGDQPVTVTANGVTLFSGPLPSSPFVKQFETPSLKGAAEVEIRISSPLVNNPETGSRSGVGVEEIRLMRRETGKNTIALSRFSSGEQWFQNKEFLTGELFRNPEKVTLLTLIGGEPLLIKEARDIMRHLIGAGAASNIELVVSTNGTEADEEWFALSSKFRHVSLSVSIDGFGAVNEYIRFPSVWNEIENNIMLFREQPNTMVIVNMTVQSYNVLQVVDLIEFCEKLNITFRGHLLHYPDYLSALSLPSAVRKVAADRLRAYAEGRNSPQTSSYADAALALAAALESGPLTEDPELLRRFMLFTNDIDASRKQSFATALPELRAMIEQAGHPWIQGLTYATAARSEPAPEAVSV